MKIAITKAGQLSTDILLEIGIPQDEASLITENLIDAELANRKSHGLVRLIGFVKKKSDGELNTEPLEINVISESESHLHIDGNGKMGFGLIYKSLDLAFEKIKSNKLLAVGIGNTGISGFIGSYARKATEKNLIFIAFNNSPSRLVPYGSIERMWGTNPLTVGIPTNDIPVILDMASSKITLGDILVARTEKKLLEEDVVLDKNGIMTTDPDKAVDGGLLPIAGHKGSGLGFVIELLGGALTGSRVGNNVPGGWGSFYILIDPTLFRPLTDFKNDVEIAIKELKESSRMRGFDEIYFAGEQSYNARKEHLRNGEIEITEKLLNDLYGLTVKS